MSNSSSVGSSGGVSPHTSDTTERTEQTGQTNDHRKVTVGPEQNHIPEMPEDLEGPKNTKLTERKVAHHIGSKKLKPMPGSDDGYKPLGNRGRPSGDGATPVVPKQGTDSQEGQPVLSNGTNPRVSVESTEGRTPLPPLTPEQQIQKRKINGALQTAYSFIRSHKNTFSMLAGGTLSIVSMAMMALPGGMIIAVFPAMFGYTMMSAGFSFGMMNNAESAGSPPPAQPGSESKEKKETDKPGENSESPTSTTPKGHFAKINHVTDSPEVAISASPQTEETSAEAMARKGEMLKLHEHLGHELKKAIEEDIAARSRLEGASKEARSKGSELEDKILDIMSDYAARAGLKADDDVMNSIVEGGKIIADALDEKEGMSQEERQKKFQELFVSLAKAPGISDDAIKMLCGALDDLVQSNGHKFNETVNTALNSTSEALKVFLGKCIALPLADMNAENSNNSSDHIHKAARGLAACMHGLLSTATEHQKKVLETMLNLDSVHDPDKDLQNMHHVRQLSDAIEAQGRKDSMEDRDVEQIKKKLLNCCLDLLDTSMSTKDFRAALLEKVDSVSMAEEHDFLEKALTAHQWFRED